MKNIILVFLVSVSCAFSQAPARGGQPPRPVPDIQASPQQAQTVTIQISADLATALESLRLNTRSAPVADPASGVVTQTPVYADVPALVIALLSSPGGLFDQVLKRFPSGSVKATQGALKKAQQDADAAEKSAMPVPK